MHEILKCELINYLNYKNCTILQKIKSKQKTPPLQKMGKQSLNNYTFGFNIIVFVPITVESLDFVVKIFAEFVGTYHFSNPRRFALTK